MKRYTKWNREKTRARLISDDAEIGAEALERLAAYEDTGVEPEELEAIAEALRVEREEHRKTRKRMEDMEAIFLVT